MLEIYVVTLFPEMFKSVLSESIMKRALERNLARVNFVNFRDFTEDKHRTVDDSPFGGGAGMLLKPEPLFRAIEHAQLEVIRTDSEASDVTDSFDSSGTLGSSADSPLRPSVRTVLMSPQGKPFNQSMAELWASEERLILVCGHYEGFDERVRQSLVTDEVSLGDFVMTGGEIAAMAIMDAVIRLLPEAVGNHISVAEDSFSDGLLEYPQYTRPVEYRGMRVPDVLLSGNHKRIAEWRRVHALYRTWKRRPELLARAELTERDQAAIARFERGDFSGIDVL